jgi:hypothetical protein
MLGWSAPGPAQDLLRRCTNLSFSEELLKEILAEIEIDGIGKMDFNSFVKRVTLAVDIDAICARPCIF